MIDHSLDTTRSALIVWLDSLIWSASYDFQYDYLHLAKYVSYRRILISSKHNKQMFLD